MQNRCDITVVIPCYNSGATIERAVKSVVSQTLIPKEIIIVDDCSSDIGMKIVLEAIKDSYAHLLDIKIIYAVKMADQEQLETLGVMRRDVNI